MTRTLWRNLRTVVRYVVYAFCVIVVVFSIFVCGSFLMNPFGGFAGESEFTASSGNAAKRRLPDWPVGVITSDVESVSFKSAHSRDSYSSWYRIELTDDAALTWSNRAHAHQEKWCKQHLHNGHEGVEGVNRTIDGPPPLHSQTGETPRWWSPPAITFRATEVMLWYDGSYSGVGRATYTAFDETNQTLWIYDYACQNDILWPRGNVPKGDVFTTPKQAGEQP